MYNSTLRYLINVMSRLEETTESYLSWQGRGRQIGRQYQHTGNWWTRHVL